MHAKHMAVNAHGIEGMAGKLMSVHEHHHVS